MYQHPEDPTSIVKVHRVLHGKLGPLRKLRPAARRFGPFRESYVEYKHYVSAMNRHGRCPDYLPEFRGFVDTTLGIGQVFQKVSDAGSEDLAPTIADEIATGRFDGERLISEVRRFFAQIKRDRVIFRDLSVQNICVVHDAQGEITRWMVWEISRSFRSARSSRRSMIDGMRRPSGSFCLAFLSPHRPEGARARTCCEGSGLQRADCPAGRPIVGFG